MKQLGSRKLGQDKESFPKRVGAELRHFRLKEAVGLAKPLRLLQLGGFPGGRLALHPEETPFLAQESGQEEFSAAPVMKDAHGGGFAGHRPAETPGTEGKHGRHGNAAALRTESTEYPHVPPQEEGGGKSPRLRGEGGISPAPSRRSRT